MRKIKSSRQPGILEAALEIAQEQGLEAVSMRSVAQRINLTPMALYGYFRNKDALLDGLIGKILEKLPIPDSELHWAKRIEALAIEIRQIAHRYPGVFPLLLSRPSVAPESVKVIEPIYQALIDAGIPPAQVPRMERLISTFVLGFAVSELSGRFSDGSLTPHDRREQLGPDELPAHFLLSESLDITVDWGNEFKDDLNDIISLISNFVKSQDATKDASA
jgi:AcrR family transcriptional regulator